MYQIDMNEWDKRLEDSNLDLDRKLSNKVITQIIEITISEKKYSEKELYNIWSMRYYNKDWTPYNNLPEKEKIRLDLLESDFEFNRLYEEAESNNWIFDNCSENVKRKTFPWLFR